MHPEDVEQHSRVAPPMPGVPMHGSGPEVDAIVAGATASTAASAPPPASRQARRRARRIEQAHAIAARRPSGNGGSPAIRMLAWGLVAMLALGVAGLLGGAIEFGGPTSGGINDMEGGRDRDGSWSYYHDRDFETGDTGAKWSTDRSRSLDADDAVLGTTTRWEYDGPYRYGPYGSDGMRRRSAGRESADPLYSQPAPMQDVFSAYGGDLDPSGGQPVGVAPSHMTNPYFDPYAGYSNPYANRIRLAYGEGVGRGASYDPNSY